MDTVEKLAYFFEPADLVTVFDPWPREIGLVLCMEESGHCEIVLHHMEESAVLQKVAAVLRQPVGDFAVVPPMRGLPTRRVMFSDEQRLLSIVTGEDELPEMAADYLINYQYTQRRKARPAKPAPEPLRRAEPIQWRPRLHLSDVRHKPMRTKAPDLPGGYAPLEEVDQEECLFTEGVLILGRRGVRLIIAPDLITARTRARRVTEVRFRDDYSRFSLPRECFTQWEYGDPLVVDMDVDLFPAGLQRRFAVAPRMADITVTQTGVFVTPGAEYYQPPAAPPKPREQAMAEAHPEEEAEAAPMAARTAAPEPRRNAESIATARAEQKLKPTRSTPIISPLRLALVAMTGVGMMAGSVIRAVDTSDPPAILRIAQDKR